MSNDVLAFGFAADGRVIMTTDDTEKQAEVALSERLLALKQMVNIPMPPTPKGKERWIEDLRSAITSLPTPPATEEQTQALATGGMVVYELEIAIQALSRAIAMSPIVHGIQPHIIQGMERQVDIARDIQDWFVARFSNWKG